MRTILYFALFFFVTKAHALTPITCRYILRNIDAVRNNLVSPNVEMILNRGLQSYIRALGPHFLQALKNTGQRVHWVDLGAGDAFAMREALLGNLLGDVSHLTATPVAVGMPRDPQYSQDLAKITEKLGAKAFHPSWGHYVNELKPENFEKADLVTDYLGALSYTEHLDTDAAFALNLLKPRGRLILTTTLEDAYKTIIRTPEGDKTLADIFENASGVKVIEQTESYNEKFQRELRIVIERTEGPVRLRELTIEGYNVSGPPQRIYKYAN